MQESEKTSGCISANGTHLYNYMNTVYTIPFPEDDEFPLPVFVDMINFLSMPGTYFQMVK